MEEVGDRWENLILFATVNQKRFKEHAHHAELQWKLAKQRLCLKWHLQQMEHGKGPESAERPGHL
jgi:hypothetical protein